MIRISKLTDYGIVLLTHFAREAGKGTLSARQLADASRIPLPTVGKILKILSKGDVLESQRGINGGYRLARSPEKISAAEIIALLEGPIAMTDCSGGQEDSCDRQGGCPARSNWMKINRVVLRALKDLTLADMAPPTGRKGAGAGAAALLNTKIAEGSLP